MSSVDTSGLKALGSDTKYEYAGANAKLLERFESPFAKAEFRHAGGVHMSTVAIKCPEFTSLCPVGGRVCDPFSGSGTTLVIEPLNRKESNLCNSVADGVRLARQLNRPEVRGLADLYHMDEEHEPLSALSQQGGWLAHIHLADTGRMNPGTGPGVGAYHYPQAFAQLKAAAYAGLMSCECGLPGEPVQAMRGSMDFLRQTWRSLEEQ